MTTTAGLYQGLGVAHKAELEDDGRSSSVSLEEVTEVVKQLHSGKAPAVDEICPEMLNALVVEGLS